MSLNIKVPEIAITPDIEDDDDVTFLSLAEALTDVEELFEDTVPTKSHCHKKKLKIKVVENDGYNTALEDVEASDNEETITIRKHVNPIALDKIDMEQFSVQENYEVSENTSRISNCLGTRSSSFNDENSLKLDDSFNCLLVPTDIEDYETDNEIEEENDTSYPDLEIYADENVHTTQISDEIQNKNDLEDHLKDMVNVSINKNFNMQCEKNIKPRLRRPPTFSQMMKAKQKSEENQARRRRRNKLSSRKSHETRGIDGSDSSETEVKESSNRRKYTSINSLNYESDLEEENHLPFPVCKKTFPRKKEMFLEMPGVDASNITDVEDIDCDVDLYKRRISVDGNVFQQQLDEMASCYSFTKDKNEFNEDQTKKLENSKLKQSLVNENHHKKGTKPQIETAEQSHNCTPMNEMNTDTENFVDSATDDDIDCKLDPATSVETAEESCDYSDSSLAESLPELALPPPSRALVISEENNCIIPTVRILPLNDEVSSDSDIEVYSTEEESFNSEHELQLGAPLPSPSIPNFDSVLIKFSENSVMSKHEKIPIEESLTDIEDLDTETKQKNIPMKLFSRYLIPSNYRFSQLTDTEELDMSDEKSISSFVALKNFDIEGHTDIEYLKSSDDELHSGEQGNRYTERLQAPSFILPVQTDVEDIIASTDDEVAYMGADASTPVELRSELDQSSFIEVNIENSSKIDYSAPEEIMYLKGGGYQEVLTDTELIFDDVELQLHNGMDALQYFSRTNIKCKVTTALGQEPSQPASSHDTSTLRDEPQATSQDKEEGTTRQQPLDQHQLSEEMKELLKEMEKTSKQ